jgi:hypothetical protein
MTRTNEMYDLCQPAIGASLKAKLIRTKPATPVNAPGRSNLTHHLGLGAALAAACRLLSAGMMKKLSMLMSAHVMAKAQKDHCHQPFSAQSDEKAEPVTIPIGPIPPKQEMEKLRLRPIGNVRPMRAMPLGTINQHIVTAVVTEAAEHRPDSEPEPADHKDAFVAEHIS